MTIGEKFEDEKLQYGINRADKYEYQTFEEILPPKQYRSIQEVKFSYSPLGKAFEK